MSLNDPYNRIRASLEHLEKHLEKTEDPTFRYRVIKLVEIADSLLSEATSLMDNVYGLSLKDT